MSHLQRGCSGKKITNAPTNLFSLLRNYLPLQRSRSLSFLPFRPLETDMKGNWTLGATNTVIKNLSFS